MTPTDTRRDVEPSEHRDELRQSVHQHSGPRAGEDQPPGHPARERGVATRRSASGSTGLGAWLGRRLDPRVPHDSAEYNQLARNPFAFLALPIMVVAILVGTVFGAQDEALIIVGGSVVAAPFVWFLVHGGFWLRTKVSPQARRAWQAANEQRLRRQQSPNWIDR